MIGSSSQINTRSKSTQTHRSRERKQEIQEFNSIKLTSNFKSTESNPSSQLLNSIHLNSQLLGRQTSFRVLPQKGIRI